MTTVVARDGAVFRGELVERLPGHYVTLRLPTGQYQRILWHFIASMTGPDTALTDIDFRADDERATLQKQRPDGSWFDACATPCTGKVASSGLYRVAGDGIRPSEPFRLYGNRARIEAEVGTRSGVVAGAILGIGGGAVAYIGLMVLLLATTADAVSHSDPGAPSSDDAGAMAWTGGAMLIGGGAVGVTGLILLLNNHSTDVRFHSVAASSVAPGWRPPGGLSIPIGKHLELTERGLTF